MYALLYFAAGLLLGTLAEYFVHRLVGHAADSEKSDALLLSRHAMMHHRVFTKRRGFTATRGEARRGHIHLQFRAFFIVIGLIVVLVGGVLPILGWKVAFFGGLGLLTELALYDLIHWMHHVELPRWLARMPIYRQMRAAHHEHHINPDCRFAVVFPLWDYLFFTHKPVLIETGQKAASPAPESEAAPRTRRRARATTTMEDLLSATLAEAEAELDAESDRPPGTRKRKRQKTGQSPVPSEPGAAGEDSARPRTRPATRPMTRRNNGGEDKGDSTRRKSGLAWLKPAAGDTTSDLDIQVQAVREDND